MLGSFMPPSPAQAARPGIAQFSQKPPLPWKAERIGDLARPDALIIIEHAHAPGTSDPPGFSLDNCSTQRNLDEAGRKQAQALGDSWKDAGIFPTRIFTSAWCRCVDTALQLKMGPTAIMSELNAISDVPAERARRNASLKDFIHRLDPKGGPYIMVTHRANIEALTGQPVGEANGIVAQLTGTGILFHNLPTEQQ